MGLDKMRPEWERWFKREKEEDLDLTSTYGWVYAPLDCEL